MERILKILIISIISFLLLLWIITGVNSCKDKKDDQMLGAESDTTTMIADTLELTDDIFSENPSANTDVGANTPAATNTAGNSDLNDYVGNEQTTAREQTTTTSDALTDVPEKPSATRTASSSKPYFIIAGNYIDKSNAEVMKKKLLKLNFDKIEIVNFDMSQYYTVIAGRYNTESEARNLASKLKNKEIDCYVKKRQN